MSIHVDTVIIGAGQAGLALSRLLTEQHQEHVVLERGHVGERWRSERWDSFRLLTPNWQARLPGYRYEGPDTDGFMDKESVVRFFEDYAASFDAPVRTGVTVTSVSPDGPYWAVQTDQGDYRAHNVVVATGHMDLPKIPAAASEVPPSVMQLHSSLYRNPDQLPQGGVLVVGAGPSGQQIARELAAAGRRVVIAAGRHRTLPRRYRGHDVYWWMERLGMLQRTVDSLPDPGEAARTRSSVLTAGADDLDLRVLAAEGVVPTGRFVGIHGSVVEFAGDLACTITEADDNRERLKDLVDDYVERTAMDAPTEARTPPAIPTWAECAPRFLDLNHVGIGTVVWATGYGRSYGWVEADVFDAEGEPIHRRGVTDAPGLYFLGLRWLYRRNSGFIDGVGADAAFLAGHLSTRQAANHPAAASSSR
jgi:putative flavoprotein involved in K+ transport